jgi:hypothetical protein
VVQNKVSHGIKVFRSFDPFMSGVHEVFMFSAQSQYLFASEVPAPSQYEPEVYNGPWGDARRTRRARYALRRKRNLAIESAQGLGEEG